MDSVTAVSLVASVVQHIATTISLIPYANDAKSASKDQVELETKSSSLLSLLLSPRYDLEQSPLDEKWLIVVRDSPLDQITVVMDERTQKMKPRSGISKLGANLVWPIDMKECYRRYIIRLHKKQAGEERFHL